jgi:TolB-like protein/two-component SAPR family response regulator/Tfp pilus assembly protein PilF
MEAHQHEIIKTNPKDTDTEPTWRFQVLGRFQAWYSGALKEETFWGRRKTLTLLKILLSEPGRVFTQDELIEWLFVDLDPHKAVSNLQARMSELRRCLEPEFSRNQESYYIETVGGVNYRWRTSAPYQIDVIAMQSLFREGEELFTDSAWNEAKTHYQSAFDLMQGDYLPEDRYEEWALNYRETFKESIIEAYFNFAECQARLGKFTAAIESIRNILGADPYRERAFRVSMLYAYLAGEQNEAHLTYQRCAQILRSDIGVIPSADTRNLYGRIQRQEVLTLDALRGAFSASSIAILPLSPLSDEAEGEYFSDGLTEDIIAQLSKIPDLKVISRTSVMKFKTTEKSLPEIGAELNVSTILEGSVRWSKKKVRVVVQLIRVDTDVHLWAETYDRELKDIFVIQSELARDISKALQAQISPSQEEVAVLAPTQNLEAYHLHLKGRFFLNKRTEKDFRKAIEFFSSASEMDPNYAAPLAGLADAYGLLAWFSFAPMEQNYPISREYAERALQIDGTLAEAYTSLAYEQMNYEWNWVSSEESFINAIELNPNYVPARHWYAELLSILGRMDEALEQTRIAIELDPLSAISHAIRGWIYYFARDYDTGLRHCQNAIELDPALNTAHWILGQVFLQLERYEEAIDSFRLARDHSGDHPSILALTGFAHANLGESDQTEEFLDQVGKMQMDGSPTPIAMATLNLGLKRFDKAVEWLQTAYENGKWFVPFLGVEPRFEELYGNSAFQELLSKLNLKSFNTK